jgi:hypothetical protein
LACWLPLFSCFRIQGVKPGQGASAIDSRWISISVCFILFLLGMDKYPSSKRVVSRFQHDYSVNGCIFELWFRFSWYRKSRGLFRSYG